MGRRPRAAAGAQGAGRHTPGTAARQAAPGHLRQGIGELKVRRSGGGPQSPTAATCPPDVPSCVDPTLLSNRPTVCPSLPVPPSSRSSAAGGQVGTRLRSRDVPTVSMSSYQSSRPPPPGWEAQRFRKPTCGVRARASSSESVQTESCFRERLICLSDFFFLISFRAQPPKPQTSLPER